jgi:hypothetical protein
MKYNISPSVLGENPFTLKEGYSEVGYSYAILYRMATQGKNNCRLEVVRQANGVLSTSADAIARYELAVNLAELGDTDGR